MPVIQTATMLSTIATAIKEYKEYAMEREFQKTERHRITAQLKLLNKLIDSKREIVNKMIDKHFAQLDNFMGYLQANYERALEKGHVEIASECLKALTTTTNSALNNTFIEGMKAVNGAFNFYPGNALTGAKEAGLLSPGISDDE